MSEILDRIHDPYDRKMARKILDVLGRHGLEAPRLTDDKLVTRATVGGWTVGVVANLCGGLDLVVELGDAVPSWLKGYLMGCPHGAEHDPYADPDDAPRVALTEHLFAEGGGASDALMEETFARFPESLRSELDEVIGGSRSFVKLKRGRLELAWGDPSLVGGGADVLAVSIGIAAKLAGAVATAWRRPDAAPADRREGASVLRVDAKARCATCGAWSPLDGPDAAFACRLCAGRTELPRALWQDGLGLAVGVGHRWGRGRGRHTLFAEDGHPLDLDVVRDAPVCPGCGHDLDGQPLFAADTSCPRCDLLIPVEPARCPVPEVAWVLRSPPSAFDQGLLAEVDQVTADQGRRLGSFDRDTLPDALASGVLVPHGRCWIGVADGEAARVADRARVEAALAELDGSLRAGGFVAERSFAELLALHSDDAYDDDEPSARPLGEEDGSVIVGCALLSTIGLGLVGLGAGGATLALLFVMLLGAAALA